MTTYGTSYGGWWLPTNCVLDQSSIVVSAGVGEDVSFDVALQSKYGCTIYMFDPTERAIQHIEEVKQFYANPSTFQFSGNIQKDYIPIIQTLNPDFSKIHMSPIGLWNAKEVKRFYKQDNKNYVSQSFIPNMFGKEYTEAHVDRLRAILQTNEIDVLKLDIEGSELEVMETLIEDNIYPKFLCVEFDYYLKGCDKTNRTKSMIRRFVEKGYKILYNKNWNITFQHIPM